MTSGQTRGVWLDDNVVVALQLPNLPAIPAGISKVSASLAPTAVAANTTVEQAFTVAGILPGDGIDVTPPALTSGIILGNARCSAANTLQLQFSNVTAGSLTPPAGVHQLVIVR